MLLFIINKILAANNSPAGNLQYEQKAGLFEAEKSGLFFNIKRAPYDFFVFLLHKD
ncbi:hypothetical protein GGR35_002610 [Mucilaginibacter phyllosphaerae]|uniref:Uncharacterized protein n=1 Tax=Mucilaginibacter phyllosphaerae TaxID=1812349 RepID=A0ABR6IAL2_9SPHI|nr:hypothetical protein [Mucilaginibacter phyllosphaerae]